MKKLLYQSSSILLLRAQLLKPACVSADVNHSNALIDFIWKLAVSAKA